MGAFLFKSNETIQPAKPEARVSSYGSYIDELTRTHKIVVFSKTTCYYCTKAKESLDNLNMKYHKIELDVQEQCPNQDCTALTRALMLQTRMKTVPQIFINGKLIGGFTDLDALIKNNKLKI